MAFNTPPDSYLQPYISPWTVVSSNTVPGEPVLLELAKALMATNGQTPLLNIFPEEIIPERVVVIQQSFEGVDTIFPLVEPGKPDVVLSGEKGVVRQMMVSPLYIRQSASFSPAKINYVLREGTVSDRKPPEEIIREEMDRMTREHALTWDVYRSMMLLGGINYTDPRTGVGAQVSARIPAWNIWSYNNTDGYQGRNEATFFRSIVDSYSTGGSGTLSGISWAHPDADAVNCIRRLARWFEVQNKSRVTRIYLHPDLLEILNLNSQVRLAEGGVLFNTYTGNQDPINMTATSQQTVPLVVPGSGFDRVMSNGVGIGPTGLTSIAGIPIETVQTKFKDPVDGIWKYVWPKNKVVLVSEVDPQGTAEAPGRTQYCIGENLNANPGLWVRMNEETQIPAAPGRYVQMGNAGMPYLKYPYRVAQVTVATVDDINNRLGVLPDLAFGSY